MWRRTSLYSCLLLSAAPLAGQSGPTGSPFVVAATSNGVYMPDVAYDATNDLYLVVWREASEVRVRRVRADGTTVGAILRLGPCTSGPRVANVAARDAFVVIWNDDRTLKARAVDAAIGAVGSAMTVASSAFSQPYDSDYDLGGEATESHGEVVVVWSDKRSSIRAAEIGFSSRLVLSVVTAPITIMSSTKWLDNPRIANSGGAAGRYLVVWHAYENHERDVHAAVLDRDARVLDATVTLELRSLLNPVVSTVDGDGSDWVVAFSQREKNGSDYDVFCRSVSFDPANPSATAVGPARIVEADPGDDELQPAVGWLGGSALIAYYDETTASDVHAKSVDLFTCAICEPQFAVDDPNSDTFFGVEVASERSGGGAGEGALIVWARNGGSDSIRARAFVAEDGLVTDLGGGCGGGQALATCARAGHAEFRLRLLDGLRPTGRLPVGCYLLVSPERIDATCGPCRLVPDPSVGFVVSTTSTTGEADFAVPLPASTALQGVTFYTQWFQPSFAAPCSSLGVLFSNAIQVRIQ